MASTDILSAVPVGTAIRCPRKRGNSKPPQELHLAFAAVPRFWLYTQAAIVVFVVAGMIIAITKL